jgi:2'-5' RNA ligase
MGDSHIPGGDPEGVLIGVSLAVPEPYASQVQHARTGYGDLRAAGIPTHVTLLPPTSVPVDALDAVEGHLARAAEQHRPFRVRLRGTETFRPVSQVVYIRLDEGIQECRALEASVRSGPLARELGFPYHPHVTVAHDVPPAELDRAQAELRGFDAEFRVEGFSLYRFGADEVWRPVRTFAFTTAARATR